MFWFLSGSGLLRDDVQAIMRNKGLHIMIIGVLIGFLLYILTVFLGLSVYMSGLADGLKDKLGMYFYVSESVATDTVVYDKIIALTDDLEQQWLETLFVSKEDAFGFLEQRVPNIGQTFEKFGITNPLPPTLYVMFDDEEEYMKLKSIIVNYKDIIVNVADVQQEATLTQQEQRSLSIINFSHLVSAIGTILVLIMFGTIISLWWFMIKNVFDAFHRKIEVKKLLGASQLQIIYPFLSIAFGTLLISVFVMVWLVLLTSIVLGVYVEHLFAVSFWSLFGSYGFGFGWLTFLILLVIVAALAASSYGYIRQLAQE